MEIQSAQIKFLKKGGFYDACNEGVRHIKVLPYLSVVQSLEGSYEISLGNGTPQRTGEGGFFIAPSHVQQTIVHHVNRQSGHMSARWIFVDVEINRRSSLDALYQFPVVAQEELKKELQPLFDRLFEANDVWQNYSDCYAVLGRLLKTAVPISDFTHGGIREAVAYMKTGFTQEITVRELSHIAKMSESNFYVAFRKQMGISPIAYLNHYRMSLAADRLIDTSDTVSEIGYAVGIRDPLYFSKMFKKTYGLRPKAYRAMYRKGASLPKGGEVQTPSEKRASEPSHS